MYDPRWNADTGRYENGDSYFDRDTQQWMPLLPPKKKGSKRALILAGTAIAALVVGLAAFGPDADVDSELSVADGVTPRVEPAAAPTTPAAPQTTEPEYSASTYDDALIPFLRSEGVSESETVIRTIAQAACATLRDVSYPGDPNLEFALQGMLVATEEMYPTVTEADFIAIVGGGIMVYCDEFEQ